MLEHLGSARVQLGAGSPSCRNHKRMVGKQETENGPRDIGAIDLEYNAARLSNVASQFS
jgi:hypothetical protein